MKKLIGIILSATLFLSTFAVFANDEWYLIYKKKDATIAKYKGPYDSRVECTSDRYNLDYDEEFIRCQK